MDKQISKLNEEVAKILGNDADYIIIAHKNGQCGGSARGDINNIAQAFFALLHQDKGELAKAVYRIIKLNVMNIMANPSPYAIDLSQSISNVLPEKND